MQSGASWPLALPQATGGRYSWTCASLSSLPCQVIHGLPDLVPATTRYRIGKGGFRMYPAGFDRILNVARKISRRVLLSLLESLVHICATPWCASASGFIPSSEQEYFLGEAIPLEAIQELRCTMDFEELLDCLFIAVPGQCSWNCHAQHGSGSRRDVCHWGRGSGAFVTKLLKQLNQGGQCIIS